MLCIANVMQMNSYQYWKLQAITFKSLIQSRFMCKFSKCFLENYRFHREKELIKVISYVKF